MHTNLVVRDWEKLVGFYRDVFGCEPTRSNQLRGATRLARLWRDQDKLVKARDLLRPIYDRFTEGIDTLDLEDAKTQLDQLG